MKQGLSKATRVGWVWTSLEQVSGKVVTLIVGLALARLLEPEAFGIIATVSIFINVMQQLVNGGISQRVLQKSEVDDSDYLALFWSNLVVSGFLAGGLMVLGGVIESFFDEPRLSSVISMMATSVFIANSGRVHEVWLLRRLQFKKIAIIRFVSIILGCVVGLVLAYRGYGVWALLWQQMSMGLVLASVLWIMVPWRPRGLPQGARVKELYKYGTPLFVSQIARGVAGQFINVLIARRYSSAELGYFDRGRLIPMNLSTSLGNVFTRVNVSTLSRIQHEHKELQKSFGEMQKLGLGLCTILLTSLTVYAHEIVVILLGSKWIPSIWYFQTGCVAAWIYLYWTVNADLLRAIGNVKNYFYIGIVCAILQITGVFVGGNWAIQGMIIGDLVARGLGLLILIWSVGRYTPVGFKVQFENILYLALWALLVMTALLGAKYILDDMWLKCAVGGLIAVIFAWIHIRRLPLNSKPSSTP